MGQLGPQAQILDRQVSGCTMGVARGGLRAMAPPIGKQFKVYLTIYWPLPHFRQHVAPPNKKSQLLPWHVLLCQVGCATILGCVHYHTQVACTTILGFVLYYTQVACVTILRLRALLYLRASHQCVRQYIVTSLERLGQVAGAVRGRRPLHQASTLVRATNCDINLLQHKNVCGEELYTRRFPRIYTRAVGFLSF